MKLDYKGQSIDFQVKSYRGGITVTAHHLIPSLCSSCFATQDYPNKKVIDSEIVNELGSAIEVSLAQRLTNGEFPEEAVKRYDNTLNKR